MVYGYARVSTNGQAKDGNSLEAQEKLLREHGATQIYSDHFTGAKMDRPELGELLKVLKKNDTLIVCKLDRFARTLVEGYNFVNDLISKGIRVNILNIGVMDNTPTSKAIRGLFLVFAEFEKDMIRERTQEGKSLAKTREGYREGRPPEYTPEQLRHAVDLLKTHSYKEVERMTKMSRSTLSRAKAAAIREAAQDGDGEA